MFSGSHDLTNPHKFSLWNAFGDMVIEQFSNKECVSNTNSKIKFRNCDKSASDEIGVSLQYIGTRSFVENKDKIAVFQLVCNPLWKDDDCKNVSTPSDYAFPGSKINFKCDTNCKESIHLFFRIRNDDVCLPCKINFHVHHPNMSWKFCIMKKEIIYNDCIQNGTCGTVMNHNTDVDCVKCLIKTVLKSKKSWKPCQYGIYHKDSPAILRIPDVQNKVKVGDFIAIILEDNIGDSWITESSKSISGRSIANCMAFIPELTNQHVGDKVVQYAFRMPDVSCPVQEAWFEKNDFVR